MKTTKHLFIEIVTLNLLFIAFGYYWLADIKNPNDTAVILLFALASFIYTGLSILGRYPHKFNYPVKVTSANKTLLHRLGVNTVRYIKLTLTLFFAFYIVTIAFALPNGWTITGTILFFIIIMGILATDIYKMFGANTK